MGSEDYTAVISQWKFPNFEGCIVILGQNVLILKKNTFLIQKYLGLMRHHVNNLLWNG